MPRGSCTGQRGQRVRKPRRPSPHFTVVADFGWLLLAAVLILGGGGYWLDQRLGTLPWATFIGILLGLATAFQSLFRRLGELERQDRTRRSRDDSSPGGPPNGDAPQ